MSNRTKKILQSVASFAIGFIILYFVFRNSGSDVQENIDAFWSVKPIWLIATCLCYMLTNVSRALRWNMLLKPLGCKPSFYNSFWSIMLGYLANLGIPRSGEFFRAGSLARYEDIPFEKAFGTIVLDRTLDVLSLLIIIALGLILQFNLLIDSISGLISFDSMQGKLIIAGIGLLGLIVLFLLMRSLKNANPPPLIQKIQNLLNGFKQGLLSIKDIDNIPVFLFHSVVIWLLYFVMTFLCMKGFGPTSHITASQALIVFIFGVFGMIIPTPGGMGSYQLFIQKGVGLFGVSSSQGLAFGNILFFTIQVFCNIFFGVLALIFLPILNRKKIHPETA